MRTLRALAVPMAAASTAVGGSPCDRAEYVFFTRHLNHTQLDSANNAMAAAHEADPADENCRYLWSRIHISRRSDERTKPDKLTYVGRARAIAETLIAPNGRHDEGHCWRGAAQGRLGQTSVKQELGTGQSRGDA